MRNILTVVLFAVIICFVSCSKSGGDNNSTPTPTSTVPILSIADVTQLRTAKSVSDFRFYVSLNKTNTQTITVQYTTVAGTAVADKDYTTTSGTLTITPNQSVVYIDVPIIGDSICKPDQIFYVQLSSPANATVSAAGKATGTIQNYGTYYIPSDVNFCLTTANQSSLLKKQTAILNSSYPSNSGTSIAVDTTQLYQTVDGFGFALTGGSTFLINGLPAATQNRLLQELFTTDSTYIGVSYLRISVGASDLSATVFSYDDVAGDTSLSHFNINAGDKELIPVLQKIVALNPNIKILASPWSAPAWMKNNNSAANGSLLVAYYLAYANYLVKYIQTMKSYGIDIATLTPQNEPLNGNNNPSMVMQASEEMNFVKNYLGPAFKAANITTKILVYDHNCDNTNYATTILNDPQAAQYVDGSAFHLYSGDISALTTIHNAFPAKNVYFTEQWVGGPGNFAGDLQWHVQNLIIGATRNWSKNVLEWNLASDPSYNPHTNGGCSTCLGGITIGNGTFTRNVGYYIIGHASKFVQPGAVRVSSTTTTNLSNVAFINPNGKKVLIVLNAGTTSQQFSIQCNGKIVTAASLDPGSVGSFVW